MHLEITIISEVSQIDKYYMILLIHGIWKNGTDDPIVTNVENKSMITKGRKGIIWDIEIDKHILQYLKYTTI